LAFALITGSAKRIGKEIAIFLAKKGWDIILHYNTSSADVLHVKNDILSLKRKCILYKQNFLEEANIGDFIKDIEVDLLINNASIFENDKLTNIDYSNLFNAFSVNLFNPIMLSEHLSKNNKNMNIINILDTIIHKLPKNFTSYYMSKISLANFTKLSAKLYAPNIRVNGIALGQILKNKNQSQKNFDQSQSSTPLGYSGNIDEICATIDFILNTKSITGQIISLDGGEHLNNHNYS
jgi:NAD(P)-dependent dehydrogenase (short-subunit alcohol dehydrogenase family)